MVCQPWASLLSVLFLTSAPFLQGFDMKATFPQDPLLADFHQASSIGSINLRLERDRNEAARVVLPQTLYCEPLEAAVSCVVLPLSLLRRGFVLPGTLTPQFRNAAYSVCPSSLAVVPNRSLFSHLPHCFIWLFNVFITHIIITLR